MAACRRSGAHAGALLRTATLAISKPLAPRGYRHRLHCMKGIARSPEPIALYVRAQSLINAAQVKTTCGRPCASIVFRVDMPIRSATRIDRSFSASMTATYCPEAESTALLASLPLMGRCRHAEADAVALGNLPHNRVCEFPPAAATCRAKRSRLEAQPKCVA